MNNYKKLRAWQLSVGLSVDIYKLTNEFPSEEKYGLRSQIRRCAVSIPSNIAERLNLVKIDDFEKIIKGLDEIQRMITGLKKSLKTQNS